ncbi:hypothetical protein QAD02_007650 [Eretmocerus hayati]|uniref:Uncharacterized protein n=1 Tax=Eretmocerus hayati TaxID=131215 RepID=A0ACC2N5I6_9HYME|nr:hypothetical protein QAD02_007650 [Eretmocerus hayati]
MESHQEPVREDEEKRANEECGIDQATQTYEIIGNVAIEAMHLTTVTAIGARQEPLNATEDEEIDTECGINKCVEDAGTIIVDLTTATRDEKIDTECGINECVEDAGTIIVDLTTATRDEKIDTECEMNKCVRDAAIEIEDLTTATTTEDCARKNDKRAEFISLLSDDEEESEEGEELSQSNVPSESEFMKERAKLYRRLGLDIEPIGGWKRAYMCKASEENNGKKKKTN